MAAPNCPVLGANGKMYRNVRFSVVNGVSVVNQTNPTWDEVPNVRDVEVPLEFTDVDVSSRLGGGFKQHEPALADLSFNIIMLYNPADLDMARFIESSYLRRAEEFLIFDSAWNNRGGQGWRGLFKFFKYTKKEGIDGIMEANFDVKLCYNDIAPRYVINA